MKQRILCATGIPALNKAIEKFEDYELVGIVDYNDELIEACSYFNPDILIIGNALTGKENFQKLLLDVIKQFPSMRIIYLNGELDFNDIPTITFLYTLIMAGVYDIVFETKLNAKLIKHYLDNPKNEDHVKFIINRVSGKIKKNNSDIVFEEEIEETQEEQNNVYHNLYVVSSIKPGTGKSFLSTNLATAIAKYGKAKNGKRPKVALIEADLQNLSIGTLLQIEDDKHNLKTVMDKISTIIDKNDEIINDLIKIDEVNKYILESFKPYKNAENLYALVGSQLKFKELENIKPSYYSYLINVVCENFDVVIVDTNSSLSHVTTLPLLILSKYVYYVLNLDFNNIRNNVRYKDVLEELGITNKVKYVLNEDIINDENENPASGVDIEKLIFTADNIDNEYFKLEARIPQIPKTVFLNRLFEGVPIILDDNDYTLKARYEILKVANQIWEIEILKKVENDYINYIQKKKNEKNKKKFRLFFR